MDETSFDSVPDHTAAGEDDAPVEEEDNNDQAKCFSQVQSKRFWAPLLPSTCRLCPSMDLVVLGMQPANSESVLTAASLWLHRTVSWQRLSTLTNNFDGQDTDDQGVSHVEWSSDGRTFALALTNGTVVLYQVEAMVSSTSSMSGESASPGLLCAVPVAKEGIVGLKWAVGRSHPGWKLSLAEEEEAVSWSYRCKFLDKASDLLPPSEHQKLYRQPTEVNHGAEVNNSQYSALPTCKTPLSLLCVATKGKGLHIYLHGRYRLLTLPMMAQRNVEVVCSPDLSHLLVHQEKSMNLSLFSIPSLSKQKHNLQIISSLYCSITSHLEALQKHVPEILASWKVSIKPLDTKIEALVRLLKDYGVEPDLRQILRQYILIGSTSASEEMSNAIEQFFNGVQMNDQLVTRMERSLQAAIANVETTARSFLLGPSRALAFHAGELLGLARFAPSLLSPEAAKRNLDLCGVLLTTAEFTMTKIVEARFRLRDFIAWLRAKGSEVKAKGTAPNSAQSENAKKRRVPQATVEKMLSYLRSENYQSSSVVERLLGIPLTELLQDEAKFVYSCPVSSTEASRDNGVDATYERSTPTVLYATKETENAVVAVFETPRTVMAKSIWRLDLFLPVERKTEFLPVAIHSRMGRDQPKPEFDFDSEDVADEGFFSPTVLESSKVNVPHFYCRQWSIIAKTTPPSAASNENYTVKLYMIPHGWSDSTDGLDDLLAFTNFDVEEEDLLQECGLPFYLTTEIVLPEGRRILDLAFYGDDGKSNLTSGVDSGPGRERRQALGLLLASNQAVTSAQEKSIELWLIEYDSLKYQAVAAKKDSKQIFLDDGEIQSECRVIAKAQGSEEIEEEEGVVFAKARQVGSISSSASLHGSSARLMLSGSRGIGGIITTPQGVTTLELFDLEEDEEPESEDGSEAQPMDA
ncbi:expressed unknown protein [Seminavis robusta]|uniref:Anaphase-promoting complex subunit 4 n=1 Tax=Seminavis robusta TaxID=568900 RepID=A0A9N8H6S0_9STRA|nr:expressed unknown protein [Seminavis robusta]|eukprot:Sro50_g029210.1 n/a (919) ;mRNA; f:117624-120721